MAVCWFRLKRGATFQAAIVSQDIGHSLHHLLVVGHIITSWLVVSTLSSLYCSLVPSHDEGFFCFVVVVAFGEADQSEPSTLTPAAHIPPLSARPSVRLALSVTSQSAGLSGSSNDPVICT
jgi:hypothetical protein